MATPLGSDDFHEPRRLSTWKMPRLQPEKEFFNRHAQYSIATESLVTPIEHESLGFRVVFSEVIESRQRK